MQVSKLQAQVSSHLKLCQRSLDAATAGPSRSAPASSGERAMDMGMLLLAGAWFYLAGGRGSAARNGARAWLLSGSSAGSGVLMPDEWAGLERSLALVILLAALSRVVMVRT